MTRQQAIAHARTAGYHKDAAGFTRLLIEQRVGRAQMNKAWQEGVTLKERGMACGCRECKP